MNEVLTPQAEAPLSQAGIEAPALTDEYWDRLVAERDEKVSEAVDDYAIERQAAVDEARADVEAALSPE